MGVKNFDASPVAQSIPFDNSTNGFAALNVQQAIEENLIVANVTLFCGDGSDGDLSISAGTTNLVRDMYYNSVTISGSAILNTNGFIIFCRNGFIKTGATSVVQNNGAVGGNGSGQTAGVPGAAAPGITVGAGQVGAAGGLGGTNSAIGAVGVPAPVVTGYGSGGGNGGQGGQNAAAAVGAVGGTSGAYTYYPERIVRVDHTYNNAYKMAGQGGSGGGGGRSSGLALAGGGGAGGSGGGVVIIFCKTFSDTSTLGISATGGKGGNGGNAPSGTGGGGGGAGGGGGGFIFIVGLDVTIGVMTVTGGALGTGGTGIGGGATGANGVAGSTGHYSVYSARTNAWTVL